MCGSCTDPGGQSDGGGKMLSAGVCAVTTQCPFVYLFPFMSFFLKTKGGKKKKEKKRRMKKIEIKKLAAGDDTRVPTISSGEEKRKGQNLDG